MGMTLGEKIIARAAGVDFVKPNDIHTVTLDRMMSNDGTTHLTVDMYHNQLKNPKIADKDKVVFIMDHTFLLRIPKLQKRIRRCVILQLRMILSCTRDREYAIRL